MNSIKKAHLQKKIREFHEALLPDCNKEWIARMDKFLTIVYGFKGFEKSTNKEILEYQRALRNLEQAGIC